jgi:hypothetical protein
MVFPVFGDISYRDTFGDPRDGGRRRHAGIDIFGERGLPIVAIAEGVVEKVSEGRLAGQYVIVLHDNGWRSKYLHMNNDSPGTDDGAAIGYADGIEVGMRVRAGTVVGYLGDSGNAESTAPHLHFSLHQPDGLPINPYRALVEAPLVEVPYDFLGRPHSLDTLNVDTFNTELVSHIDPDGAGSNGDIALSSGHVFLGSSGRPGVCPGTGVRVFDVTYPAEPWLVSRFADSNAFPGTAAESLWVGAVESDVATDIAVVGLRLCHDSEWSRAQAEFAGFAIYDIGDPSNPELLSAMPTGEGTLGVQHLDVLAEPDRVLVAVTVPNSHQHDLDGRGDVRLYDVTDPSTVVEVSDWDLRRDGPQLVVEGLRARVGDEAIVTKGVTWLDAGTLAVAHSAAGMITIDVSDVERPAYIGAASSYDTFDLVFSDASGQGYQNNAEGGWVHDGSLLVQDSGLLEPLADESGEPAEWGQQTFYDIADPSTPLLISTFGTESSHRGVDGVIGLDGFYSALRSAPYDDGVELVAWSSDGVRLIDIADPSSPAEVAFFVPMAMADPAGTLSAPDGSRVFPLVRDITVDGTLVFASDLNSGLWVFRILSPLPNGNDPKPD